MLVSINDDIVVVAEQTTVAALLEGIPLAGQRHRARCQLVGDSALGMGDRAEGRCAGG
jgi:hypothetical protein